jgi:hypothetical protein
MLESSNRPLGVWATINQIKGPHETAVFLNAVNPGHSEFAFGRSDADKQTLWIKSLVAGNPVTVDLNTVKAKP